MDISKVRSYMKSFDEIEGRGARLTGDQRNLRDKIFAAPVLDRMDIYVLTPHVKFDSDPVWEHHQAIADYQVQDGHLSIIIGTIDADNDYVLATVELYPEGRWLKMRSELVSVENPFYRDPTRG